jgi:hypothetical protein
VNENGEVELVDQEPVWATWNPLDYESGVKVRERHIVEGWRGGVRWLCGEERAGNDG